MFFSSLLPCQFVAKKSSEKLGDRGCLMAKQGLFAHQTAPVCPPNRGCWQTNGVFIAGPCISCSDRLCGGTPADDGPSSITTAAPSYTPKQLTVSAVRQSDGRNHKKECGGKPCASPNRQGQYVHAKIRRGQRAGWHGTCPYGLLFYGNNKLDTLLPKVPYLSLHAWRTSMP